MMYWRQGFWLTLVLPLACGKVELDGASGVAVVGSGGTQGDLPGPGAGEAEAAGGAVEAPAAATGGGPIIDFPPLPEEWGCREGAEEVSACGLATSGIEVRHCVCGQWHELGSCSVDDFVQVSVSSTVCALRLKGTVVCASPRLTPNGPSTLELVQGLTDATSISVDSPRGCAVRRTGHIVCWSLPGSGDSSGSWKAEPVTGIADAVDVAVGEDQACALTGAGRVMCWNPWLPDAVAVEVTGIHDAVMLSVGRSHACVVRKAGEVACWGSNGFGELGQGELLGYSEVPVAVSGVTGATVVAAGSFHTCAVAQGGKVLCWGSAEAGYLGDGTMPGRSYSPVEASHPADAPQVINGRTLVCSVNGSGRVLCWGSGIPLPEEVVGLGEVTNVSADHSQACALRANGTIACWEVVAANSSSEGAEFAFTPAYEVDFKRPVNPPEWECKVK
jgi:hypothetical protein